MGKKYQHSSIEEYGAYIESMLDPGHPKAVGENWLKGLLSKSGIIHPKYIALCTSGKNAVAAVADAYVLSRIVLRSGWNFAKKHARITHKHEGHVWMVNTYADMEEQWGIPVRTIREIMKRLVDCGMIFMEVHFSPFHGQNASFVRLNWRLFLPVVMEFADSTKANDEICNLVASEAPEIEENEEDLSIASDALCHLVFEQVTQDVNCYAHTVFKDIQNIKIGPGGALSQPEEIPLADEPSAFSIPIQELEIPKPTHQIQSQEKQHTQNTGPQTPGSAAPLSPTWERKPIPKPTRPEKKEREQKPRSGLNRGSGLRSSNAVAKRAYSDEPSVSTNRRAEYSRDTQKTPQDAPQKESYGNVPPVETFIYSKLSRLNFYLTKGRISQDARELIHRKFPTTVPNEEFSLDEMYSGDGKPMKANDPNSPIWTGNPKWRQWADEVLEDYVAQCRRDQRVPASAFACALLMDWKEFRAWMEWHAQREPEPPFTSIIVLGDEA